MSVTGIGGFFFRAQDAQTLAAWYAEHRGVGGGEMGLWDQRAGPTVFSPFDAGTDYFPADKQWMLNLHVEGLDAVEGGAGSQGDRRHHESGMGHAGRGPVRTHPRPRRQCDRAVGARLSLPGR
jgi:glyoxylase I family protein